MQRPGLLPLLFLIGACSGEIYLRDGVTDGDTFYLADRALADPDPVLQSWVSYSLTRSACQLLIGGENPARASAFECEWTARRHLVETWSGYGLADPSVADPYLDTLAAVHATGFLREYVAHYFGKPSWRLPPDLEMAEFSSWRRARLRHHRPLTRLVGSWNYARKVNRPPAATD